MELGLAWVQKLCIHVCEEQRLYTTLSEPTVGGHTWDTPTPRRLMIEVAPPVCLCPACCMFPSTTYPQFDTRSTPALSHPTLHVCRDIMCHNKADVYGISENVTSMIARARRVKQEMIARVSKRKFLGV